MHFVFCWTFICLILLYCFSLLLLQRTGIAQLALICFLAMAIDSAYTNRLPSLKFVADTLSVSTLIGRMTLTFDLLTSNLLRIIARRVGTSLLILVFLRILFFFSCHVTSRPWPLRSWHLSAIRVFVLHQYTKLEVRRPIHSEDMTHFRSSISRPGNL